MKFQTSLLLALPALSSAFPFMAGGQSKEEMLRAAMAHAKANKREPINPVLTGVGETVGGGNNLLGGGATGLNGATGGVLSGTLEGLSGYLGGVTSTLGLGPTGQIVAGLLGSVASSINPDNKRPQPGYVFKDPLPTDSRGPCPGLNLLANYGYLPRDGYVSFGEVVNAVSEGFNMGADLATILAIFATLTDGNIKEESWWLGTDPTHSGGLNRHSTVEVDISPNKEDYYLGCGDNHHISSRIFTQNVQIVNDSASKVFDIPNMAAHYAKNAKFSQTYNPWVYYFPFPSIVSIVAFNFYPAYFSNGTYGSGGVANYESISSIVGAQYDPTTDQFKYVPERWPENWYRRDSQYGAVVALTQGFTEIYPAYPVPMAISQLNTPYLSTATIFCDIYQGIGSITPLALDSAEDDLGATLAWVASKFALVAPGSLLGCPNNTISPNFYPNNKGSAVNPPPAEVARAGNNVYNKIYFPTAPTTPSCS